MRRCSVLGVSSAVSIEHRRRPPHPGDTADEPREPADRQIQPGPLPAQVEPHTGDHQQRETSHRNAQQQEKGVIGEKPEQLRAGHQRHANRKHEEPEPDDRGPGRPNPLPKRLEDVGDQRWKDQTDQGDLWRQEGGHARDGDHRHGKSHHALDHSRQRDNCKAQPQLEGRHEGKNRGHSPPIARPSEPHRKKLSVTLEPIWRTPRIIVALRLQSS